jgi:serpin B
VDFGSPQALAAINGWVSERTRGKIPRLVEPGDIGARTLLVLLNAIYFKGVWAIQFRRDLTRDLPFRAAGGSSRPHPLMQNSATYPYFETKEFQAIRLPYGAGRQERLAMYVFLPAEGRDLVEWAARLDAARWKEWSTRFARREGTIVLPRFKIEYQADLVMPLAAMGMALPFTREADFSALSEVRAYISRVIHQAVLEVNEEGSEAAAATAVVVRALGFMPEKPAPFRMIVDRPFFCAIADGESGAILFMGIVADPGRAGLKQESVSQ